MSDSPPAGIRQREHWLDALCKRLAMRASRRRALAGAGAGLLGGVLASLLPQRAQGYAQGAPCGPGGSCPPGETCVAGLCLGLIPASPCPRGWSQCGGQCVDTQVDPNHCGGCGTQCSYGVPCSFGACTVEVLPSPACANTLSDPNNCGRCGDVCAAPPGSVATCDNGVCGTACPAGFRSCSTGTCVPAGGCCTNADCPAGQACTSGACTGLMPGSPPSVSDPGPPTDSEAETLVAPCPSAAASACFSAASAYLRSALPDCQAVCQDTASAVCGNCVQPRADTAIKSWVDCLTAQCGATASAPADDGQSPARAAVGLADLVALAVRSAPAAVSLSVGQPCTFSDYSTCAHTAYGLYALNCAGQAKTQNDADDPLATYQRALSECKTNSCNATAVSGCLALVCNGTCQPSCASALCCSPSTGVCVAPSHCPNGCCTGGVCGCPTSPIPQVCAQGQCFCIPHAVTSMPLSDEVRVGPEIDQAGCVPCSGSTPCPDGCCSQGTCYTPAVQSAAACGPVGGTCQSCPSGATCQSGQCICTGNSQPPVNGSCAGAGGGCRDCPTGLSCPNNQICAGGCDCPAGRSVQTCWDSKGFCQDICCPSGTQNCGGTCLSSSVTCPGLLSSFCETGGCVPPTQRCTQDSDCCSGSCAYFGGFLLCDNGVGSGYHCYSNLSCLSGHCGPAEPNACDFRGHPPCGGGGRLMCV